MIDPIEVCDFFRPGAQTTEIFKIQPSPENAAIYRKRTTKDTDFRRLVVSIEENGVQTPLLVSRDGYVISGHQRLAAAQEAGLTEVPIIVLDKHRYEYSVDEWVGILREHNVGREKTLDERIREEIVDIDPDEAMDAVINDQINRSRPKSNTVSVPLGRKTRSKITSSRPFADAVRGILTGILKSALPVPERAIHYHLLPLGVRTSTSKNGRIYQNDTKSLKALSNILTRMRLNGEIPWEWISDETRPVSNWKAWPDAAAFLGEELETLYSGFARNLMCSQSTYYEIILEKLTIRGFIDKVAARYTIPTVTLRGNSGIDARHKLAERFRASGKKSLVLFILTDCDPAGDEICESTVRSLRDEFGISGIQAIRVAMTHAQADAAGLAKALETKKSSVEMKFRKRHGRSDCYELEAVSPEVLSGWLDEQIRGNIDVEAYNHEVAMQAIDVSKIRATRTATRDQIRAMCV